MKFFLSEKIEDIDMLAHVVAHACTENTIPRIYQIIKQRRRNGSHVGKPVFEREYVCSRRYVGLVKKELVVSQLASRFRTRIEKPDERFNGCLVNVEFVLWCMSVGLV